MPARPCSVAASGPAGSRWPQRDHHPRKACSAPTGRRFPSCSCRSPHPRPTQAHFASRHRTPPPRLTLERPQPRGLPRVTAPAPGPFPSATSPPRRPAKRYPSCEPAPDLLSLTKLACKRFHKGGAGRSGAPGNRGCLIPQLRFPWNQAPSPRHEAMSLSMQRAVPRVRSFVPWVPRAVAISARRVPMTGHAVARGTAFRPFTFACPGKATTPGSFSCTLPVIPPLQRRITSADGRSSRGRSPKATWT